MLLFQKYCIFGIKGKKGKTSLIAEFVDGDEEVDVLADVQRPRELLKELKQTRIANDFINGDHVLIHLRTR